VHKFKKRTAQIRGGTAQFVQFPRLKKAAAKYEKRFESGSAKGTEDAGDAAASLSKFFFIQNWLDLGKIKILHPQKHSISYGYGTRIQSRSVISYLVRPSSLLQTILFVLSNF